MDGWMDGWTDGRMDGWVDGWMDGWMDGMMDRWMDGRIDEWMERCTNQRINEQTQLLQLFFLQLCYENGWMDERIKRMSFEIKVGGNGKEGRKDGRTIGRTEGQKDGRKDGRKEGRKEGGKERNGSDGPLQERPGIEGFDKMVDLNNLLKLINNA